MSVSESLQLEAPAEAAAEHSAPSSDACPTPLAWSEVLAVVREGRREEDILCGEAPVRVWRFGAGPKLYLLGSTAGDSDLFVLIAWLLREERTCVAMDWPEGVETQSPERAVERCAGIVRQVIEQQQDGPVLVFGTGFGGLVAMRLAADASEVVNRVMVQGAAPGMRWSWFERLMLSLGRHLPGQLGRLPGWGRLVEANHRCWFPPFDQERWGFLKANLAGTTIRRFVSRLRAFDNASLREQAARVARPVLIIRTEGEGAAWTTAQEELAASLPDVRVEWMHSAGHFPHVTHPHRLVKVFREFLPQVM